MKISFYKTGELNGSNYVKIPLRTNAILNIDNFDKYCFLWSVLDHLHPCNNNHANRVSNCRQYFDKLNFESFDFSNGFICSGLQYFEKLNNLSINLFEINFYQDQNEWKHNLIPIEVSKNDSDRFVGLIIYKNQYALIKKLHVFLGSHNKIFVRRRCLNSYTSEKMLMSIEPKCENFDKTTIRTSMIHFHLKKSFS